MDAMNAALVSMFASAGLRIDDPIDDSSCIFGAWRCTAGEAFGQGSVLLYLTVFAAVTVARGCCGCCGGHSEKGSGSGERPARSADEEDEIGGLREGVLFLGFWFVQPITFFLMFPLLGVSSVYWAHPVQASGVQAVGGALALACIGGFLGTHCALGTNWMSQPGVKQSHGLVVQGVFRCARHPMYASVLWVWVAMVLGTLNWVIVLVYLPNLLLLLSRIRTEERDMSEVFGDEYRAYQDRVSALGPVCCCCFQKSKGKGEPWLNA